MTERIWMGDEWLEMEPIHIVVTDGEGNIVPRPPAPDYGRITIRNSLILGPHWLSRWRWACLCGYENWRWDRRCGGWRAWGCTGTRPRRRKLSVWVKP